jgi:GNAT superfamily N-acetyltransferase
VPEFPDLSRWIPPIGPGTRRPLPAVTFRHPTEADAPVMAERWTDWRENGRDAFPGRAWFRDFAGTAWLAETEEDRRPVGVLLGHASPERAGEIVIRAVIVGPEFRRKGVGRALVARFEAQGRDGGARLAGATCRPDDRAMLAFFGALGYAPVSGPGTRLLYGVPAFENWDGQGEDRVLLEHPLG